MWQFLSDLTSNRSGAYTVVIFEEESTASSREYIVKPRNLRWLLISAGLLIFFGAAAAAVFSPLPQLVRGNNVEELRRSARMNAMRVAALQDSLAVQQEYARHLGALVTGRVDSSTQKYLMEQGVVRDSAVQGTERSRVHEQPAVHVNQISAGGERGQRSESRFVRPPGPDWPTQPPVEGFVTQGFDVQNGHYAVDVAVEEGSRVYSVASGFVVFADWTQEAGQVIAVQHPGGYLSVYKHNNQLLKQAGDRVTNREPVAISGNTGHITTGPHVHFELWHDGLAQDPRHFILGW
jgi:murein DD-endopeptidase MepM/ murein hydrolase activator NlpD